MTRASELVDEVVVLLTECGDIPESCKGEDGFEDVVWQRLWHWVQQRCGLEGPWASVKPGWVLLTSHSARKERDSGEWDRFQAAPGKLADSPLLDGCSSRVDIIIRSPLPELTIGVEIERIKSPVPGKKPKADPFIHGLGQAAISLMRRRQCAILVVYWPVTESALKQHAADRKRLRAELEGLFRDGRLRVVVVP